ncbi:MAG: exo-alpha-sialidase [Planctomycetes bacterium]|nr:exo-alpha-sialidase [Planctomycetota bacterium]
MSNHRGVSRRGFVSAGMALGAGAVATTCPAREPGEGEAPAPGARPLAQDHVVLTETNDRNVCTCGPGIVGAPDGSLLATVPYWWRGGPKRPGVVHVLRSSDGGVTWERRPPLEYFTAMPWTHDGAIYLFAHRDGRGRYRNDDLVLRRSEDGGRTWSKPVTLFEGPFWNCPTGIVMSGGYVYRAFDQLDVPGRAERVAAGDLSRDLMDPAAWRISPPVAFPGPAPALCRGGRCRKNRWLEPNVIQIGEKLRVLSRVEMDSMATANVCGVCDLDDDGERLSLEFVQYHPMPGGQNKFHIVYDDVSRLFWTPATLVTDSQDQLGYCQEARKRGEFTGGGGNERRILMLMYSVDALNWFQAGCIAMASRLRRSFMYASPWIDGEDLLIVSRTSHEGRDQHDADRCTFHRVSGFRRLALDLYPEVYQD